LDQKGILVVVPPKPLKSSKPESVKKYIWKQTHKGTLIRNYGQQILDMFSRPIEWTELDKTIDYDVTLIGDKIYIKNKINSWKCSGIKKGDNHYYLNDLFAGGRFIIVDGGTPLKAELIINGSGLPIISWNKGELIKVD